MPRRLVFVTMLNMLKHRLLFGTSMILLLVGLFTADAWLDTVILPEGLLQNIFLGRTNLPRGLVLMLTFVFLAYVAAGELATIFHAKGIEASKWVVRLAAITGCTFMYAVPAGLDSQEAVAVFATMTILLFMIAVVRHSYWSKRTQGSVGAAGAAMFVMIYMGVLPGFYLFIRRWHDIWVIAAIMLITKSCDIGAYFTGRFLGKHKLIPWLSPGKTWEGLIGGMITSSIVAVGFAIASNSMDVSGRFEGVGKESQFIVKTFPIWGAAIAGLILGAIGQAGDLIASLFKRDAGIKDSGNSIPGFGGLLDVIDSPIVTAPFAFWLLKLLIG